MLLLGRPSAVDHRQEKIDTSTLYSHKLRGLTIENDYWKSIKSSKIQTPVNLTESREINQPSPSGSFLKVVCLSDTHGKLNESHDLLNGDVLIVAGDLTNYGSEEEVREFNRQMGLRPHKYKLVIAGNHDYGFDINHKLSNDMNDTVDRVSLLTNATYLEDKGFTIEGVKFYGSPWHPVPGAPFYANRTGGLTEKWASIPDDTDVLITHTPPVGYLDLYGGEERWGCKDLLKRVEDVGPRFHIFGHVHECHGTLSNGVTTFINAAQLRKQKIYENSPIIFYIQKKTKK